MHYDPRLFKRNMDFHSGSSLTTDDVNYKKENPSQHRHGDDESSSYDDDESADQVGGSNTAATKTSGNSMYTCFVVVVF